MKLLMSGSGQCNMTHSGAIEDFLNHYGGNQRFLRQALRQFSNVELIDFFQKRGLRPIYDDNGKVFPHTRNAGDVLGRLLDDCRQNKVDIHLNESVSVLAKTNEGFEITTNLARYTCTCVVIATGGNSYAQTGSSGDGYRLAANLGHRVIEPKPALTPVFVKSYTWSSISGVSLENRSISLYRQGKKIAEHRGDMAFTHKGLTGPGILDFSRYIESGDMLRLNIVDQKEDTFARVFLVACQNQGRISIKRYLKEFNLPESLVKVVLEALYISPQEKLAAITKKMRNNLVESLCGYPFQVEKLAGFNVAMVTAGGVSLKEVSPKTMESRLHKGLFFAGEVLDIDGHTGGYNIQAAFSTAFLAAKTINN